MKQVSDMGGRMQDIPVAIAQSDAFRFIAVDRTTPTPTKEETETNAVPQEFHSA